jgi:hypothetical protein
VREEEKVTGRGHRILALLIQEDGRRHFIEEASLFANSSEGVFMARKAGTKASVMRRWGGPHQALCASRSCQRKLR